MKNTLIEYVRNNEKQPVGVIVALSKDKIGFSFLNTNSSDKWNKQNGMNKAIIRAENIEGDVIDHINRRYKHLSDSHRNRMIEYIQKMKVRAEKYFK